MLAAQASPRLDNGRPGCAPAGEMNHRLVAIAEPELVVAQPWALLKSSLLLGGPAGGATERPGRRQGALRAQIDEVEMAAKAGDGEQSGLLGGVECEWS